MKEKHDLEEQENALQKEIQALKQQHEALKLKTQLAISSSKIAVLMSVEEQQGSAEEPPTGAATDMQAAGTQVKKSDKIIQSKGNNTINVYFTEMSMKNATPTKRNPSLQWRCFAILDIHQSL